MKKYGITKEELQEDRLIRVEFKCSRSKKKLMVNIILSVTGVERWCGLHKRKSIVYAEVTRAEEAEIRAKFNFYSRVLDEEQYLFYSAFIHKNNIIPKNLKPSKPEDLTQEEFRRAMRINEIAESIRRSIFYKTLSK